jgi:hypothetical protein
MTKRLGVPASVALAAIALGAAENAHSTVPATAASECVSRGGLPDLRCTPRALNPDVKQKNIRKTICVPNWTDTVRPPTSYTNKLKVQGIADHGFKDKRLSSYEEDHLIPLAVGGSPRSPKNLWPEPHKGKFGARVKDKLERFMHDRRLRRNGEAGQGAEGIPQLEGGAQAVRPVGRLISRRIAGRVSFRLALRRHEPSR